MSTQPSSSPPPPPPTVSVLFPLPIPPVPEATAPPAAAGGARQLSRWERAEEFWFAEETDYSHSGINE